MSTQKETSKQKKISIRFFLNKTGMMGMVSGIMHEGKIQYIKRYSLYVYITYNRKNMQFRSKFDGMYVDMDEVKKKDKGLMEFEEKLISKVIRYETSLLPDGEEYDMKGLKERYENYSMSIFESLEKYFKPRLITQIEKTKSELRFALNLSDGKDETNNVLTLYKVAELIFPNFQKEMNAKLKQEIEVYKFLFPLVVSEKYNCPTIIDWQDGSYKGELKSLFSTDKKYSTNLIDESLKLIGAAVEHAKKEPEK